MNGGTPDTAKLAVSGVPPFNGFQSKLALLVAGAHAHVWWAVIIGIGASLVTLLVLAKAAKAIFWGKTPDSAAGPPVREAPLTVTVTMVILATLCLAIGLYPKAVYAPLKAAASVVQTVASPGSGNAIGTAPIPVSELPR